MENKNCYELLEKIFIDLLESDLYTNSSDCREMDRFNLEQSEYIQQVISYDTYQKIQKYISLIELNNEKYGFIMGFKYAMRLRDECMVL